MIWRALRTIEHLLTGALICVLVAGCGWLRHPPAWQPAVVRWWHARLCRILALDVRVSGKPARGHTLLVANHVSWIDIPVVGAQGSIGFLSKAEVRRWPVVGWMAAVAGTVFIERGAHRFAEAITAVRQRIENGYSVVLFPEGTTTNGNGVKRFLARLFAVLHPGEGSPDATDKRLQLVTLQPLALRYGSGPEPDAIAPFIDETELVPHLIRVLRSPGIVVQVFFLPVIEIQGKDRKALAQASRAAIVRELESHSDEISKNRCFGFNTDSNNSGNA